MSQFLRDLQKMVDNQEPVQNIIDKIENADKRRNSLVFIFLLSFILEALLRKILENSSNLATNIELYYKKYGNINKNTTNKINKIRHIIDKKSLYNIKKIRNSIAHDGQIYNPKQHKEFIETSLGFIYLIADDRGIDLKKFILPKGDDSLEKNRFMEELKIKKRYFFIPFFIVFLIVILFIFQPFNNEINSPKTYILGGVEGGTYDAFSKNISTNIIEDAKVRNSKGSIENMKLLNINPKNERVFAFVQKDVLEDYLKKAIQEDSQERDTIQKIRVLFPIVIEEIHILVRDDSNISTFSDLKNKIISFGSKNSGTSLTMKLLYRKLFNKEVKTKPYQNFNKTIEDLKYGNIDAIVLVGGQPIYKLLNIDGVKLVPYLKDVDKNIDGYSLCSIHKNSYNKIGNREVPTLCVQSFLITNIKKEKDTYLKSVLKNFSKYKKHLEELKSDAKEWDLIHYKWRDFPLLQSKCLPKLPFRLEYHYLIKWDIDRNLCSSKRDK